MEKFEFIIDSQTFETPKTEELIDILMSPDKFTAFRKKLENSFLTLDNSEWRCNHILPTNKEFAEFYSHRSDDDGLIYVGIKDIVLITGFENIKDNNQFYLMAEYLKEDITDNMKGEELANLVVMGDVDEKTAEIVDDFLKKQDYFREYGTYLGAFKHNYRFISQDYHDEFVIVPTPFPLFSKNNVENIILYLDGHEAGVYDLHKLNNDNYKELLDTLNDTIRKDSTIHNNFKKYHETLNLPDYKQWNTLMRNPVQKLIDGTINRMNGMTTDLSPVAKPASQQILKK